MVGGLVSAAIAIPLAMGYGMFAFTSLDENYFADGAIAGLTTALVVAVVCVVLGDKTTTVYAPRVNTTFFLGILIYGLVHSEEPPAESRWCSPSHLGHSSRRSAAGAVWHRQARHIDQVRAATGHGGFSERRGTASFSRTARQCLRLRPHGAVHEGAGAVGLDTAAQRPPRQDHLHGHVERAQIRAESAAHIGRHRSRLRALLSRPIGRSRRSSRPRHRQRRACADGADDLPLSHGPQAQRRSPGADADHFRRRAGARDHRVDRCAAVHEARHGARRDAAGRRSRAPPTRHRERSGWVFRRHHRRHQYRRQHRQPDVRRPFAAFGPDQRRGAAGRERSFSSAGSAVFRARRFRRLSW
jgi:hypothetical protein